MGLTFLLLIATALAATVDWWAVAVDARRVEYVAKPLTLVLLLGVAIVLVPADSAQRGWFVGALVASLVGDVALMLPVRDGSRRGNPDPSPSSRAGDSSRAGESSGPAESSAAAAVAGVSHPPMTFVVGLLAFLIAHLGYFGGFVVAGELRWLGLALGAAVVSVAGATVGARILRASRDLGDRSLTHALTAYLLVIGAMVVAAYGTLEVLAMVGATLFFVSDAIIGWTRFVRPVRRARVAIMITYHLGQIGLVLSLLA